MMTIVNGGKPWLSIEITFIATYNKEREASPHTMKIELVYPLERRYLPIVKIKREFHTLAPSATHMEYNGITVNKGCQDMTLNFEVQNSYIMYELDDYSDECLPYTVEGTWHIRMSDEEELAEHKETIIDEELEHVTETEREDLIMDNDVLVDSLQNELEKHDLTPEQMAKIEELGDESSERFKEMKRHDRQKKFPGFEKMRDR